MSNQLRLLKTQRFLPLFVTQFCSAFNDNAFKNAILIWFTYELASKFGFDVPTMVTFAAGLFILPFFLFSATAGQVADKYEKAWLTQILKIMEVMLMIAAPICFYLQSMTGLLIILFFLGLQATFFGPIKYSLLPEQLKDDELIGGNGLIEGGTFLSILLGTLFGGLVIRLEYGALILSSALIVISIIGYLSSLYIPKCLIRDKDLKINWNIFVETRRILGYAWQEPTVGLSILGASWFWFVGVTLITQFPIYTKEVIGGKEYIVTLFLTVLSIGIGIGSLFCNRLLKGRIDGRFVPLGCIGVSIFMVDFYFASTSYASALARCEHYAGLIGAMQFLNVSAQSWRIVLDLFLIAICLGIYIVPLYAIMQHRSDERYVARIIAANNLLNALFMILASGFAMIFFAMGMVVTYIILAVGLINVIAFFIIHRIVKQRLSNVQKTH